MANPNKNIKNIRNDIRQKFGKQDYAYQSEGKLCEGQRPNSIK